MRVYFPSTSELLRRLLADGQLGPAPLTGFAVTPGLREWYLDEDVEELEYAATMDAARASLRLLDADPAARSRRVVVAADVPESALTVRDDLDRGVVHVSVPIGIAEVASVHVDARDAEAAVAEAAAAIVRADLGDPSAQDAVDDAEGFELSWYANQEIGSVLEQL